MKVSAASASKVEYSKDNIIVVYKDGTSTTKINKQLAANESTSSKAQKLDSNTKYAVAEVPDDQTVKETIKQYEDSNIVKYAQPNYKYKAMAETSNVDDTYVGNLWQLLKINAYTARTDYLNYKSHA